MAFQEKEGALGSVACVDPNEDEYVVVISLEASEISAYTWMHET